MAGKFLYFISAVNIDCELAAKVNVLNACFKNFKMFVHEQSPNK
jgi:hypothetical protein